VLLEERKSTVLVTRSPLFDAEWYLRNNPSAVLECATPAEHYCKRGWLENRDPSPQFSNQEYYSLNPDVKDAGLCPLHHYEYHGKYEGRQYAHEQADQWCPQNLWERLRLIKYERQKKKALALAEKRWHGIPIQKNKIVFKTFQGNYVCNPKYICEKLLERDNPYDIVWLCKADSQENSFPQQVRTVLANSPEASTEIASAKLLIDNGTHMFRNCQLKKKGQVSLCTWHGSLGFKRLDTVVNNARDGKSLELYQEVHDILISDSAFEEQVYKTSYWPNSKTVRLGHARNDILFFDKANAGIVSRIQKKVRSHYHIASDKKIALYAPTFRWSLQQKNDMTCRYDFPFRDALEALSMKYGGDWLFLVRQHFVDAGKPLLQGHEASIMVDATDYPDIQELMVAADAGFTDYSSWILDYMFTRRPGFLFAPDLESYDLTRGFYYPLDEAPFPIAKTPETLIKNILSFSRDNYEDKIDDFTRRMECMEDGRACERIVEAIQEWMSET
jgi:CDP-glycerol glycerophosphotransferase